MNRDRDEYLLLARAGRTPHRLRGGPARDRASPMRPRERVRRLGVAVAGRLPALGRRDRLDRLDYLELEFAVGFGVEDEQPR
ncbi:MAG: hypothetical protein ACRDMX_02715 [Solirubrobacteraceae bacterium]